MTTIPPEVTLTHNQRVEQIIAVIRAQVATIDGFGHLPADRRRKVIGFSSNITDAELNAAAMACDAHPQLAAAAGMTGDEFREAISFCIAHKKLMELGVDDVRQEIVFRPTVAPIHSYKINLTSPWTSLNDGYAQLFDRNCNPVPFDPVPVTEGIDQTREVLLLFREPLVPGDERAPFTLRIRDTVPGALRLAKEGRDELLIGRATRADRPIGSVEIVVHLPEELSDAVITPAPGSPGTRMTPSELMRHPAPAGFITLGWKAQDVAPDITFGCNLIRK